MATRGKAGRRGRRAEGVAVRCAAGCAAGGCSCRPSYQAQVWSARDRRPIRKTFATLAQARAWRAESQLAVRAGRLSAPTRATVAKAAARWLAGAEAGVVRTRSGERYKPSALRSYARALDRRLLPQLGRLRLSALTQAQLQGLVDGLLAEGRAASTARNAILPLRAIYRRAVERSELAFNPTLGLALPAPGGRRERVARPAEARRLLAALPARERGLWATALYAGLRRGELQALRWQDIELERRLLSVERSWDRVAGPIEPKSRAGRRRVPLPDRLRCELLAHRRPRAAAGELAFGASGGRPFEPSATLARARAAWQQAGLEPVGLHDCRHSYAAFMIAAGVNPKALCRYMGHSSITVTLDRYGHLMPGNEQQAAQLLDSYLARTAAP